jgi:hypothetical protein
MNTEALVKDIKNAQKYDLAFDLAARYGEFMIAIKEGLINNNWKSKISISDIESSIEKQKIEIVSEWKNELKKIRQIIDYGGKLEFEEMMQVLTIRSELEFIYEILEITGSDLENLDNPLTEVLKSNQKIHSQCVSKMKNNIYGKLEKHWWWLLK